jgi:hypothetical protein
VARRFLSFLLNSVNLLFSRSGDSIFCPSSQPTQKHHQILMDAGPIVPGDSTICSSLHPTSARLSGLAAGGGGGSVERHDRLSTMASSASSAPQELSGRDWANLTAGPAGLIAERVLSSDVVGYLRFRAVCRAWRASSASLRARGAMDRRFHPRRWGWIMLPNAFNVRYGAS